MFTSRELFNKLYKYLERSLFDKYRIQFPIVENKYGFYVLKEGRIIIKFFLINNIMYYQKNFPIINMVLTAEDIDNALKTCDEIFCDNNFSLFLKCNLI